MIWSPWDCMVRYLQYQWTGGLLERHPVRRVMQPWIIEELWRREQDEKRRREEWERRKEIQIDAPAGPLPGEEPGADETRRGVLIIEL